MITVSLGKEDGIINTNYNNHSWLLRKMPSFKRKEGKKNSSKGLMGRPRGVMASYSSDRAQRVLKRLSYSYDRQSRQKTLFLKNFSSIN